MARQATNLEILRGKILNAPPRKEVLKEIDLFGTGDKLSVLFIEPSYRDRQEMLTYKGEVDTAQPIVTQDKERKAAELEERMTKSGQLLYIVYTAHDPESKLRLFGVEDVKNLADLTAAAIDKFSEGISELLAEDVKKS